MPTIIVCFAIGMIFLFLMLCSQSNIHLPCRRHQRNAAIVLCTATAKPVTTAKTRDGADLWWFRCGQPPPIFHWTVASGMIFSPVMRFRATGIHSRYRPR